MSSYIVNHLLTSPKLDSINKFFDELESQLSEGANFSLVLTDYHSELKQNKGFFKKLGFFFKYIYARRISNSGSSKYLSACEFLGVSNERNYTISSIDDNDDLLRVTFLRSGSENKVSPARENLLLYSTKRVGRNSKHIKVYKLRTMHRYAEPIHKILVEKMGLSKKGKVNNDFRVRWWASSFRKYWIDEIPMLLNFFKRELKLVGVRPISQSFYELYPDSLKELRKNVKPGLLPAIYYDRPKTLDEIFSSEEKYLKQYIEKPVSTDGHYFYHILKKIIVHKHRSE